MDDRERLESEDATADDAAVAGSSGGVGPSEVRPDVDARSIILSLDPEGRLGPGVSLNRLDEEMPLPELRGGSAKYEIQKLLGKGGMGKVYLAYDRDLKRHVALKTIRPAGADRQTRFLEEAQVMGQLEHPNILQVHDLGLTEKRSLYYTMPVVRGETLQQALSRLRRGDARAAKTYKLTRLVQIFIQVAQAMDYAHAKGVLHRDLKPANIMVGEHGEVQVLDWGLAKVLRRPSLLPAGDVTLDGDPSLTELGRVVGTPAYMSPEQAAGMTDPSPLSDIYSLGVVLYELLTWSLPFAGDSVQILAAHLGHAPQPPRSRAPERDIPIDLERICMTAMAKEGAARYPTAGALAEALQGWLEAESDKAERHARAEERAALGRRCLERYRELNGDLRRFEGEAGALATRFKSWQTVADKAELYRHQDRMAAARHELALASSEVVGTLTEALGFERDNQTARELLADYNWERFLLAEALGDDRERDFHRTMVERYHDGKYARELIGDGSLTLDSEPTGAEVRLEALVEENLVLTPRRGRALGRTPLGDLPLPIGSYLLTLSCPGYRDVRYPVYISRNRSWVGRVKLYTDAEIGHGYLYVPGGPFVQGGDRRARGRTLPRSEPWVADFFVAEFPVTMADYVEFLDDLARVDLAQARRRAPRRAPDAESLLAVDADGRFRIPEVDRDGDRWDWRWPAIMISWHDAVAYTEWLSAREGRPVRLPTEPEWEKAARGVDGRDYPWGNRFDASLCNVRESRRERPSPVAVDEFPGDVSVYGVRGMAGNLQHWTASVLAIGDGDEARDTRVVKGAGWDLGPDDARSATREWNGPDNLTHVTGFRVVRSAPR